jgi:hypothetical protein
MKTAGSLDMTATTKHSTEENVDVEIYVLIFVVRNGYVGLDCFHIFRRIHTSPPLYPSGTAE